MLHSVCDDAVVHNSSDSEGEGAADSVTPQRRIVTSAFQCVFSKKKLEWKHLVDTGNIPMAKFGAKKVKDIVIRDEMSFFGPQNVQLLS